MTFLEAKAKKKDQIQEKKEVGRFSNFRKNKDPTKKNFGLSIALCAG